MSGPFVVEWSEQAIEDWRRLRLAEAATVARAVERFPSEGIVIATGPSEYLLLVVFMPLCSCSTARHCTSTAFDAREWASA
jgi:hypothetical protein